MKNQAADATLQLETGVVGTTQLDHDLLEKIVSLAEQ